MTSLDNDMLDSHVKATFGIALWCDMVPHHIIEAFDKIIFSYFLRKLKKLLFGTRPGSLTTIVTKKLRCDFLNIKEIIDAIMAFLIDPFSYNNATTIF